MRPSSTSRPRLVAGCRWNDTAARNKTLLTPTGELPVLGPSLQIIERCDGRHSVAEIVTGLQSLYVKAKPEKVEQDVLDYLELLEGKGALEYESDSGEV